MSMELVVVGGNLLEEALLEMGLSEGETGRQPGPDYVRGERRAFEGRV